MRPLLEDRGRITENYQFLDHPRSNCRGTHYISSFCICCCIFHLTVNYSRHCHQVECQVSTSACRDISPFVQRTRCSDDLPAMPTTLCCRCACDLSLSGCQTTEAAEPLFHGSPANTVVFHVGIVMPHYDALVNVLLLIQQNTMQHSL